MVFLQFLQEKNVDSLANHAESFFKTDNFILYAVAAIVVIYIIVKYIYKGKKVNVLDKLTDEQVDNAFVDAPYFIVENLRYNSATFEQWSVCKLQPHEDDTKLAKIVDVVHNEDGVIGTLPAGNDVIYDLLENGLEIMGVAEMSKDEQGKDTLKFHIDITEFNPNDVANFAGLNK